MSKTIKNCSFFAILQFPRHPFRTKRGSGGCQTILFASLVDPAFAQTRFESKTGGFLRSYILGGNLFARNEVRVSRTAGLLRFISSAATFSHETSKIVIN